MITLASMTCDTSLVEMISNVRALVALVNPLRYPLWYFPAFYGILEISGKSLDRIIKCSKEWRPSHPKLLQSALNSIPGLLIPCENYFEQIGRC